MLQGQWQGLCDAMGRPDLVLDPRFDGQGVRAKNQVELIPIIELWLQTFPNDAAAWDCLEEHRVPSGPVLSPQETIDHEYYRGRGVIRMVDDPIVGKLDLPAFPLRFSEQIEFNPGAAQNLGEHNAEILGGALGYDAVRIAVLNSAGVLWSKED